MANANIEELPGVGPATADKLREAGYTNLMTIAVESPKTLADACDIGEATAIKIIDAAKKAADVGGFESGDIIFERRKNLDRLTYFVTGIWLVSVIGIALQIKYS